MTMIHHGLSCVAPWIPCSLVSPRAGGCQCYLLASTSPLPTPRHDDLLEGVVQERQSFSDLEKVSVR
jgi:hypothetical protein